ncbi:hypothetical protein [Streptomyces hokutonensis]|uniref:hypothetical protein n=1 Tax=Streptomyces hokutonensis TaxID=1306990 RepID=UPI00369D6C02
MAVDACVADPISLGCGNALVGVATGFVPMLKTGEALEAITTIGSNASRAGGAIASGARSAWRGVSGLFGG